MTRVILLILDGLGVGPIPNPPAPQSANTLADLCAAAPSMRLPNLRELGLGHIGAFSAVQRTGQPSACFGRLAPQSTGSNPLLGHWELAGLIWQASGKAAPGLSESGLKELQDSIGRSLLGNKAGSADEILQEFGEAHLRTGWPILYFGSEADCHLAIHERIASGAELARMARALRKVCRDGRHGLRVLAHSFSGEPGKFVPVPGAREYAVEPPAPTVLDMAKQGGHPVAGIGRVEDLFVGRGLTRAVPTSDATNTMEETIRALTGVPRGLLAASFSGQIFGNSGGGVASDAARQLEELDGRLPHLFTALKSGDLLIITADYGRNVETGGEPSVRQCVPLLAYGPRLARGVNLGTRKTLADVGQTVADALGAGALPCGESFLDALRVG
jgi:phosphopentomutase